jgi:hypothetical protein
VLLLLLLLLLLLKRLKAHAATARCDSGGLDAKPDTIRRITTKRCVGFSDTQKLVVAGLKGGGR